MDTPIRGQLSEIRDNLAAYSEEMPERDKGAITVEMSKLLDLVDVLALRFGQLEERLSPILSPFATIVAERRDEQGLAQSPVTERLASVRERLEQLAHRIDFVADRVEL